MSDSAAPEPAPSQPQPQPQRPSEPAFLDDPAIQSTIQHHRPADLDSAAPLDLDAILRCDIDSLPHEPAQGASIGFSRWFRRQPEPPPQPEPEPAAEPAPGAQRRSSLQDELVGNILNG